MTNNSGSWWSLLVVGRGGGGLGCWVRVWGRREGRNACFYAAGHICNQQDSLGQNFACLGEFWANLCSNIFHSFCTKVISHAPDAIMKIPMVKMCKSGFWAYSPNLKVIQRLMNPASWFYRNRFWVNLRNHIVLTQINQTPHNLTSTPNNYTRIIHTTFQLIQINQVIK